MGIENADARPWGVQMGSDWDEWSHLTSTYPEGVKGADGKWIAKFDDDYGNDQYANAELIVRAVNSYDAMLAALEAVAELIADGIANHRLSCAVVTSEACDCYVSMVPDAIAAAKAGASDEKAKGE